MLKGRDRPLPDGDRLIHTPRKFTVVAGAAEGPTRLNAFDNALLRAGCGNLNLLKVSSILPPGALETPRIEIAPGSLVPTAFGAIESEREGEKIAAAIGVGLGSSDEYGVIMEFSGRCGKAEAEAEIRRRLEAAFEARGRLLERVIVKGVEHEVGTCGCAFAAVVLWG